ncbi:PadR family transcriptional regulator [Lacisediminihabitans changchengi]|uniref:PadR family transcriptional regulator n=1 Tax=Lacisediminihabitans changchengi TaxID=2787634 RepID=A0A934SLA4_9MICO|nr:PadR family transcriptional regulator [Lacisediminihabitans changchengi]MBK4347440.1 PadR family transcriptional regulator [Lacisediminihabitans changchengi]
MSSIRLFVLGSLAERGPMHGRALVHLAEEEHIDEWTDFAASAIYGAIKRLATEGLIVSERIEKQGNYPERQVYRVSDDGRRVLYELREKTLADIVIKPDPIDLALARLDPERLDELPTVLGDRAERIRSTLADEEQHLTEIRQYLTLAESWSMRHKLSRLRGELAWHDDLLSVLPDIIAEEKLRTSKSRTSAKGHPDS